MFAIRLIILGLSLLLGTGTGAAQTAVCPPVGRLAPGLNQLRQSQALRVSVRDPAAFAVWAARALPGVRRRPASQSGGLVELRDATPADLRALLASPLVVFIDQPDRPAHDERLLNQADLTVNTITAVHRRYPALDGRGLTVSVKENPLDPRDLDFRNRLVDVDPNAVIESVHATSMATLIAGAGNNGPSGEGAARAARITSHPYTSLLPTPDASLARLGVSVQNHSYGTAIENYYGVEAVEYDRQSRALPTLLHVFSAGNSGLLASPEGIYKGLPAVANLTGQFKMSKNSVSVGATDARGRVAPQSSRGPAHDGRVKPELVAFGDAGSSDAAALVSGISLLVQQAYRDLHGGALPPSALVRAVLLNSAQDVGRPEVDFESGYGQADALAAVCTVLENRHHASQIEQDAEKFIELDIPAGTGQLKITLAWLDPEAAPNAPRALVNDLDLDLELPGAGPAQRWLPWTLSAYPHPDSLALPARRRADHLNNAEQITLRNPAPGRYRLRVRGFQLSSGAAQAYSLTYEMTPAGCEWRAPNLQRNVRPGEATALRWRWAGPATTGRIEFRPVGSAAWQLVAETVDLSAQSLTWMPPNLTTTLAQLRCLTAGQEFISDTFALTRPLPLRVGYVCAAEALLTWPAVPGATTYQVYQLGATRLEPLLTTADTLLVLPQPGATAGYYAVAPRLADQLTERSNTAGLNAAGLDCYIRSFIPRQAVADTVRLTLLLNSVYRLRAIHLQRRDPATGTFETIASRQPLRQTRLELVDLTAAPGNNQYRIWGQDAAGRSFFSGTETVQLVRAAELLVFPVPVRAGDPLFFAAEPGATVRARLYDGLGRVSREAEGNGALNSLDTHDLRPGLYVLRVTTSTGPVIVRRVVVQ